MNKKYVIIKDNHDLAVKKDISEEVYSELLKAAHILESFNYIVFLGNSFKREYEEFLKYDFSQFNVPEADMFSVMLSSLTSISTNINLWEAYLKRTYENDPEIFPAFPSHGKKKKSIFGIKDSEYYDKDVEYVVAKALRNMIVHSEKPYSEIWYDDDLHRHFIIYTEVLLNSEYLNASGKEIITNCGFDYFDVVKVINHAFEIAEELNIYIVNYFMRKEWINFYSSRITIRKYLGIDWQGAYLVEFNPKFPPSHIRHLSTISISKHAMNSILSIAANSIHQQNNI